MGGLVPAAGCGFRGACLWGGSLNGWETDERMEDASDWVGLSLGGFWVSAGVSVGKERMKDER